jgi:hypothetical protein
LLLCAKVSDDTIQFLNLPTSYRFICNRWKKAEYPENKKKGGGGLGDWADWCGNPIEGLMDHFHNSATAKPASAPALPAAACPVSLSTEQKPSPTEQLLGHSFDNKGNK